MGETAVKRHEPLVTGHLRVGTPGVPALRSPRTLSANSRTSSSSTEDEQSPYTLGLDRRGLARSLWKVSVRFRRQHNWRKDVLGAIQFQSRTIPIRCGEQLKLTDGSYTIHGFRNNVLTLKKGSDIITVIGIRIRTLHSAASRHPSPHGSPHLSPRLSPHSSPELPSPPQMLLSAPIASSDRGAEGSGLSNSDDRADSTSAGETKNQDERDTVSSSGHEDLNGVADSDDRADSTGTQDHSLSHTGDSASADISSSSDDIDSEPPFQSEMQTVSTRSEQVRRYAAKIRANTQAIGDKNTEFRRAVDAQKPQLRDEVTALADAAAAALQSAWDDFTAIEAIQRELGTTRMNARQRESYDALKGIVSELSGTLSTLDESVRLTKTTVRAITKEAETVEANIQRREELQRKCHGMGHVRAAFPYSF